MEGKNGAVVRKQIGYGPIASEHAGALQQFYTAYFNPYLNFHRPCGYATVVTNARGKRRRTYRHKDYRTPYEKLTSLPQWEKSLKEGITAHMLQQQATVRNDTEAARRVLGTAVITGMGAATVLGIFFIPALFVAVERLTAKGAKEGEKDAAVEAGTVAASWRKSAESVTFGMPDAAQARRPAPRRGRIGDYQLQRLARRVGRMDAEQRGRYVCGVRWFERCDARRA